MHYGVSLNMFTIEVNAPRPDFRVFVSLLYSDLHNVNTYGDSFPVNSRSWKNLEISDRESDDPTVYISGREDDEILDVWSDCQRLAEKTAIYLYDFCGNRIHTHGEDVSELELQSMRSKYRVDIERATLSIWHASSDETPYPNLLG